MDEGANFSAMNEGPREDKNVLISTLQSIPGYEVVDSKGFVMGSSFDFVPADRVVYAFFASIFDPQSRDRLYSSFFKRLRHEALLKLSENALKLGANAVLGASINSWRCGYGMYEVYAYGTAVEVNRI